ncbi:MAG: hypothetical protein GY861_09175 [bacterium]|nr:hypothetical protein [bacterium]
MEAGTVREIEGTFYLNRTEDPFGNKKVKYTGKVENLVFGITFGILDGVPKPFLSGKATLIQRIKGEPDKLSEVSTSEIHKVLKIVAIDGDKFPDPYLVLDGELPFGDYGTFLLDYRTRLETIASESGFDESMGPGQLPRIINHVFSKLDVELKGEYQRQLQEM